MIYDRRNNNINNNCYGIYCLFTFNVKTKIASIIMHIILYEYTQDNLVENEHVDSAENPAQEKNSCT